MLCLKLGDIMGDRLQVDYPTALIILPDINRL